MMTQFANLSARASSVRRRCTALASPLNSRRFVRINVLGQFSKESDSNRRKCSRQQRLDYCTITSRPYKKAENISGRAAFGLAITYARMNRRKEAQETLKAAIATRGKLHARGRHCACARSVASA